MALQFEATQVIDRPLEKVFQFFAVEHVRNHPRWDSDIELWLDSDAPIGVGTVIHRRNKRSGTPVEGTMQVTEFEANRVLAMVIHDGPAVMPITQKLAKNLFLSREKTLVRKAKEIVLARRMEEALSKQRILELYLNVVELGPMVYGVGHASRFYSRETRLRPGPPG